MADHPRPRLPASELRPRGPLSQLRRAHPRPRAVTALDAFAPCALAGLRLRNRIIKTATFEGMTPDGHVSDELVAHHAELAHAEVGMTTIAYGAVAPEGRTFERQLLVDETSLGGLRRLARAVHEAGGAVSIQLSHCGGFSRIRANPGWPRGPSPALNSYGVMLGVPRIRAMTEEDIEEVIGHFGRAAAIVKEAGLDAVEVHMGHGYLLSQFLSPLLNHRSDRWGGSRDARMRLPLAVLHAVRAAVGDALPILVKMNLRDGVSGGFELDDAIVLGRRLEAAGANALVLSGGLVSRNAFYLLRGERPLRNMVAAEHSWPQKAALIAFGPMVVRPNPFEEMFFLSDARQMRHVLALPLVLLGGIVSRANVDRAMATGFDFVAMGRALLSDPDLVVRMRSDPKASARCNHCNECVALVERGSVACVL